MAERKNYSGLTEMVFILDRSGSMYGLEKDAVGGFNSLIRRQKQEPGAAIVSTVLFDDNSTVLHDRIPLADVPKMKRHDYVPQGCTALLDAIGGVIHHIGTIHKQTRLDNRPTHTIVVILTDGMENASCRYNITKVRKMVKRQQDKYGWEFLFLGANMDAIATAGSVGIPASHAVTYKNDSQGIALSYEVMDASVCMARKGERISDDWSKDISSDLERRE